MKRKQADLDQVASSLPADRAIAVACHTGKPGDVDVMFARAIERVGHIDGLVNNAATNPYFGPLIDTRGRAGLRAAIMQGIYGATKAAVISMTQTLASELGGSGIRVNAIAPGLVETRFASALVGNPQILKQVVSRTPLGRHGQPPELAGAAVYLLFDAASFTTGTTLVVDGGLTSA